MWNASSTPSSLALSLRSYAESGDAQDTPEAQTADWDALRAAADASYQQGPAVDTVERLRQTQTLLITSDGRQLIAAVPDLDVCVSQVVAARQGSLLWAAAWSRPWDATAHARMPRAPPA